MSSIDDMINQLDTDNLDDLIQKYKLSGLNRQIKNVIN